jgi:hypothetical protein
MHEETRARRINASRNFVALIDDWRNDTPRLDGLSIRPGEAFQDSRINSFYDVTNIRNETLARPLRQ